MNDKLRHWLAKMPLLLVAYLEWGNRGQRRPWMRLRIALALGVAWLVAVSVFVHANRPGPELLMAWIQRHAMFWAVIGALMSGVLVARRRALNKLSRPKSWTAALPVERWNARWQGLAIDVAPALTLIGVLAVIFGSLSAPVATWGAMTGGAALGAALSFLMPSTADEVMYEGSRYVPHRRRAGTAVPTGSLSALGTWPVRQLFASARPKAIAHAMFPVLLAAPLGSKAADAMVMIGLLVAVGALALLVAAAISVSASASRWLKPLPLRWNRVAGRALLPCVALMSCLALLEAWLAALLGMPVVRCITAAAGTFLASVSITVAVSVVVMRGKGKGSHE